MLIKEFSNILLIHLFFTPVVAGCRCGGQVPSLGIVLKSLKHAFMAKRDDSKPHFSWRLHISNRQITTTTTTTTTKQVHNNHFCYNRANTIPTPTLLTALF